MSLPTKPLRKQLQLTKNMIDGMSLKTVRSGQDALGKLMRVPMIHSQKIEQISFDNFEGEWIVPKDIENFGVILYLHGGGYVAGGLSYARGFGSVLADKCGIRVFTAAYRLAPENRYPCALDDALCAYKYLLDCAFDGSQIWLCGESAGGGLIFALSMKIRELGLPTPAGHIAISPWTDLTSSGESYEKNRDVDPSMTKERLKFFADSYTDDLTSPYVSPIFGDLSALSPSIIFVGADEIMLSDAEKLHKKLSDAGSASELYIRDGMWHGYMLYGVKEADCDLEIVKEFINR